jgi:arsenite methyltransferase
VKPSSTSAPAAVSTCCSPPAGSARAARKARVLAEAARVLKPGGRFAVSDVIADEDMDAAAKADMRQFTGCIAGALTRREFEEALAAAGLKDVEVQETHRVHDKAGSAIIRARKPGA